MYSIKARSTRSGATAKRYVSNAGQAGLALIELLDLGFDEIEIKWNRDVKTRNEGQSSSTKTLDQKGTL